MNNKYGEHPKKKICVIKDRENNKQNEDIQNKEAETNEDNENRRDSQDNQNRISNKYIKENENSLSNEYTEDNENILSNKFHEDNENNEDSEQDELDSSVPRYTCDNDGNACVFLLGESVWELGNDEQVEQVLVEYQKLPKKFENTNQNYLVKNLDAHIDFDEILIDDIQELKINQFNFNNLIHINLSLFLDIQLEQQAIKFIQSILNLQSLKYCRIYIIPKFEVQCDDYIERIEKQVEFKANINKLEIQVHDWRRRGYLGFNIFSDEGKIYKLFFYNFANIKLETEQLENVEILEMNSENYTYKSFQEFLKKLINLKYLQLRLHDESYSGSDQMELLKIISELKQMKQLELNCDYLSSENIECLSISFVDTIIPIQSQNLSQLNIYYKLTIRKLEQNHIQKQLSTMKDLKILNLSILLKIEHSQDRISDQDENNAHQIMNKLRYKFIKQYKKLLIFNIAISVDYSDY